MFKPNFRYTNNIVKNLTQIAKAQAVITNSPLIPKWQISLRREALLQSAHSSTAIEGNPLTLDEVSELAAGREIMVNRKDKQEVLNYLETLEKIPEFSEKKPFKKADLLIIHKLVVKNTLDPSEDEGTFRNRQVIVRNRANGQITFRPPQTKDVPWFVDEFLKWFNSAEAIEFDPVLHAGITHYEIVRIHPFIDGNGRTARIMASLVFYIRGFDVKRFFALDDYYDNDRKAYYDALKNVDPISRDLTAWLEYFSEGVSVSVEAIRKRVIGLSKDIKVLKQKGQIALTERQMRIVERIISKGSITNREARKLLGLSDEGIRKEISTLIELGVLTKVGEGRSTHYVLS